MKKILVGILSFLFATQVFAAGIKAETGVTKSFIDANYVSAIEPASLTGPVTIEGSLFVNDSQLDGESFQAMTRSTEIMTVEVTTTGDDTTGDGSAAAPFATWQKAFDVAPNILNHDLYVNLGAGTFSESNPIIAKLSTDSQDVTRRIWLTGTVNIVNATATADGGTRTTLTDTGAFAGQDFSTGGPYFLRLLAGNNYIDISANPQFSNDYPIKSNTDDVITLDCQLASVLSSATQYQVISNATTLQGADTLTDYGLIVKSSRNIEVNIRNINFTDSYYGINNYSNIWVNACGFTEGTNGYSAIILQEGAVGIIDHCWFTGTWSNGDTAVKKFGSATVRQNAFTTGTRAIDVEGKGAHAFFYGNYVHDKVNGVVASWGGGIETPNNANAGNIIDDCSDSAMLASNGGKIILYNATGDGNVSVAEVAGITSSVNYNSTKFTNTSGDVEVFNDVAGMIFNSGTSTANFGGVEAINTNGIDISGYLTAESVSDGTAIMTGGNLSGIGGLTATGDLDIGAHGFRSLSLTADGLTSGRLIVAGANGLLSDATVTESSGALGGITTISMSGQLTNTLADGTAPLVITSTTKVSNLNVERVDGIHVVNSNDGRLVRYESTGTQLEDSTVTDDGSGNLGGIGTLSMSGQLTNTLAGGTAPLVVASTTKVDNLNVDQVDGYSMDQAVLTTSAPTFTGTTYSGPNGSSLLIGCASEEITVAALAATGVSSNNLIPANSFIIGVSIYVTDGIGGPARVLDLGPTGGTSSLYVDDLSCNAAGANATMYEKGAGFQHMSNYFSGSGGANTITITLDGATPVDDPLSARVVVWYYVLTAPTS